MPPPAPLDVTANDAVVMLPIPNPTAATHVHIGSSSVGHGGSAPKSPRAHIQHQHNHHHPHSSHHHLRATVHHHAPPPVDSAIPALFKKTVDERVAEVVARAHLSDADRHLLGEHHAYVRRPKKKSCAPEKKT